jgi:phosphoglycerol transferase
MNKQYAPIGGKLWSGWFACLVIVLAYLIFRNAGLQPIVMADEWYYSSFSRLTPLAEVSVPSYLYLVLSRATTSCSTGFLECARLMNVGFFVAAAPLIYLVGRRYFRPSLASAVALLSILGPINSYTAYFMPESLYYFCFWLLTWSAFRFYESPVPARAIQTGAVLGLLALIKVHALLLFPSLSIFLIYCVYAHPGNAAGRFYKALLLVALALASAAVVRFGLGYLCAGPNGLNPFGTLYGAQAANSGAARAPLGTLLSLALFNLKGHAIGLALLFGLPLAALAGQVVSRKTGNTSSPYGALTIYAVLVLLALLAATVGFTASIAGGGQETNVRLHMRYYNFIFPLLTMIAATQLSGDPARSARPSIIESTFAVVIGLIIVYGIATLWRPYTPSLVDSPELQGMTSHRNWFYWLSALALASLATWTFDRRKGARVFLCIFMPLFTLLSNIAINHEVKSGGMETQFDRAGIVTRHYLSEPQRGQLGIVGSDASGIFRTQFHIDHRKVWQHMAPQRTAIERKDIPPETSWLLALGDYPTPAGAEVRVKTPEFSIIELDTKLPANFVMEFSSQDKKFLERVVGLSVIEPWGQWSDQENVELHFKTALPRNFSLGLTAEAYGPNAGEDVAVTIGSETHIVKFQKTKQDVQLDFKTDGAQKIVKIHIPKPTSPQSLGNGEDTRTLGIGLSRMKIISGPAAVTSN